MIYLVLLMDIMEEATHSSIESAKRIRKAYRCQRSAVDQQTASIEVDVSAVM